MCTILWLDDERESVSYEQEIEIPDRFSNIDIEIKSYEKIAELLEYLMTSKDIDYNVIFIIDIMLILEKSFKKPDGCKIEIKNDLMAGVVFYSEYLKDAYPLNPIILYTSREYEEDIFKPIVEDERYDKTLFLVEKAKKNRDFFSLLDKLIKDKK